MTAINYFTNTSRFGKRVELIQDSVELTKQHLAKVKSKELKVLEEKLEPFKEVNF